MDDGGYWIILSTGYDGKRERGRRFDSLVVAVLPMDGQDDPDMAQLVRERPGRLVSIGIWSPPTGWSLSRSEGPSGLHERFASASYREQAPVRAAIRLGCEAAMRLALGIPDSGREPFPAPGAN